MTTMEDIEAWVAEDPENRREAADTAMKWFSLDGVGILFSIAAKVARRFNWQCPRCGAFHEKDPKP